MKLIDISREFFSAPLFGSAPRAELIPCVRMADGAPCNVSALNAGLHTSTHCDAPLHFVKDGEDIAEMPLEHFVGECFVLTVEKDRVSGVRDIRGKFPEGMKRLLLRGGEKGYITAEAAEYIADAGIITLGLEAPSVGAPGNEPEVHAALLGKGVAIIEQLELASAADGKYILFAQPLKLSGAEASPCRALLVKDD